MDQPCYHGRSQSQISRRPQSKLRSKYQKLEDKVCKLESENERLASGLMQGLTPSQDDYFKNTIAKASHSNNLLAE